MIHKNRTNNLILDGEILQMCVALILVTICEWTNVKSIAELVKFNNWSIGGFCRINHSECNLFWLFYSRLYMCVRVEVECGKSHFQHKKFPHFHFFYLVSISFKITTSTFTFWHTQYFSCAVQKMSVLYGSFFYK